MDLAGLMFHPLWPGFNYKSEILQIYYYNNNNNNNNTFFRAKLSSQSKTPQCQ